MASNKIGFVLALDGEKEFTAQIRTANKEARALQEGLKGLSEEYKGNANSMEALEKRQDKLVDLQTRYKQAVDAAKTVQEQAKKIADEQAEKLQKLQKELDEASKAQKKMADTGDTSSDAYRAQADKVEELSNAVREQAQVETQARGKLADWNKTLTQNENRLKATTNELEQNGKYLDEAKNSADGTAKSIDKFGKELSDAEKEAREFGDGVDDASKNTGSFGESLKGAAAVAAGNLISAGLSKVADVAKDATKEMVRVGSEFEKAMSEVKAISGASTSDLDAMEAKAKSLGSSTKFSASQVADGFKYMSLAGWDAQAMLSSIDGVVNLAAASEMELGEASDMVTDYLSAFGLEASYAGQMADEMAYAQANSNTTVALLGEAFGNSAAQAHSMGQSLETTTAVLEAMANQGLKGSEAGTALNGVMSQIVKNMKDGSIAIGDTAVAVTDADGNFRDLTDIMGDVEKATSSMTEEQKASALQAVFNRTSLKGVNLILSEGVDKIRGYKDELENADGAAANMASTMQDNLQGSVTEFKSAAEGLGIAIYDRISKPLTDITDVATDVMGSITEALTPPPKSELETFLETVQGEISETRDKIESLGDIEISATADIAEIEAYRGVLEKATKDEELSEFEKYQLKAAVDALGDSIPGLRDAYDEETSSINLTTDALDKLLDSTEKQIRLNAYKDTFSKAYEAEAEAALEAAKAQSAHDEAVKALRESFGNLSDEEFESLGVMDANLAKLTAIGMAYGVDAGEIEKYRQEIKSTEADVKTANDAQEEAAEHVEQARTAYESLAGMTMTASEALGDYAKALQESVEADKNGADGTKIRADAADKLALALENGIISEKQFQEAISYNNFEKAAEGAQKYGEAVQGVVVSEEAYGKARRLRVQAKQAEEQGDRASAASLREQAAMLESGAMSYDKETKAIGANTDATKENADALNDTAEAGQEAEDQAKATAEAEKKAAEEAQANADARTNALTDIRNAYFDTYNSIKDSAQINLYEKFNGGDDSTVEEMIDNLRSQNEGMKQMQEESQAVIDAYGDVLGPELITNLQSMGTDAANTWHHMFVTMSQDNAPELMSEMRDLILENMDLSEGIAEVGAGAVTAYQLAMGELGSTPVEWQGLRDSVKEMTPELDKAITEAQKAGIKIPNGLADGLKSGETTVDSAIKQLNSAAKGTLDGLKEIATQEGIEIPKAISEQISAGDITGAVQSLASYLSGSDAFEQAAKTATEKVSSGVEEGTASAGEEAKNAGAELGKQTVAGYASYENAFYNHSVSMGQNAADGLGSKAPAVKSKAQMIADGALKALNDAKEKFKTAGSDAGGSYSTGLKSKKSTVDTAGGTLATAGAQGARAKAGAYISAGSGAGSAYATGVSSGRAQAQGAGAGLAKSAEDGAKSRGTSGFVQVGRESSRGMVVGMREGYPAIEAAAAEMVNRAIRSAKAKAVIKSPSHVFRDEVGYQIGAGTAWGIEKSTPLAEKASSDMSMKILKAARSWLEDYRSEHYVALADERWYWNEVAKEVGKGTEAYKLLQEQIKGTKALHLSVNGSMSATFGAGGKLSADEVKALTGMSVDDFYRQYTKNFGVIRDADEELDAYRDRVYQTAYAYISDLSELTEVSEFDLMKMTSMLVGLAQGTDNYRDSLKKLVSAGAEYRKAQADADMQEIEQAVARQEHANALFEEYLDERDKIVQDYYDNVKDRADAYYDAVADRQRDILQDFRLFEGWDSEGKTGDVLMKNLEQQVAGLAFYTEQMEALEKRGILSQELIEELRGMGADEAANIYSLGQMSDEELAKYQALYNERERLAKQESERENQALLDESLKALEQYKNTAEIYLMDLFSVYRDQMQEYMAEMMGIADFTSVFQVNNGAITGWLNDFENRKFNGDKTIAELIAQYGTVNGYDNSLAEIISRYTGAWDTAGMNSALLNEEIAGLNLGALQALNSALGQYYDAGQHITVDNSSQAMSMAQMADAVTKLVALVSGMTVQLDTGVVAGALAPAISESLASESLTANGGLI